MNQPIQTRYKGYHFRSRLEARWAVFLDELGITWEYEKEGYELPSGWYLPDFWLPDPNDDYPEAGYWVEIKGVEPSGLEKCRLDELCHLTKHNGYLMQGLPFQNRVYHVHHSMPVGEYFVMDEGLIPGMDAMLGMSCILTRYMTVDWKQVDRAVDKAKSARFEHNARSF